MSAPHARSEALAKPSPLLDIRGLTKSFPGVRALAGVNLSLSGGQVLALVGENGAGKSTLIKILAGVFGPDSGEILIDGRPVKITSPTDSRSLGISVIHQEFNLVPTLTVRENLFLGMEGRMLSLVWAGRERSRAKELLDRLGLSISPDMLVRDLTVAQQQLVEIAKALASQSRILIMDEPTAALSPREVKSLLDIVRQLRASGIGIIYVSHRLDEVFEIADAVTVFRDGQYIATSPIREVTREKLIELMVGRQLSQEYPQRVYEPGPVRLKVEGLRRGRSVDNVSFEIRRGEIVALTGLVGAGRTETARLIFGADRADSGTIRLDGRELRIRTPRDAIAAGICLLTEDRKHQGLILQHSLIENFGLPNLKSFSRGGWLSLRRERESYLNHARQLAIKSHSPDQLARTLSGGNQQKVVLAKWLERNAEVILFDEPTRGIDVGARYEIYELMHDLSRQGKTILMITSEYPEALGMADRILVMHAGRITGEVADVRSATQQQLLELSIA